MQKSTEIFDPYAEALLSLAKQDNLLDDFSRDAADIREIWQSSTDLQSFLENPTLVAEQKRPVVQQVFGSGIHPLMLNFLNLLLDRNRIGYLDGILNRFQALVRQQRNIALAEVTTAVPLNESQMATVVEKVKAMTGAQSVELNVRIDPEIIGGVIVQAGSEVFDASVRSQLKRIGIALTRGT
jgi:F-type H+-transporting ATPase subunit delta